MRRSIIAILAALAIASVAVVPVGARSFGHIYAEGDTYRTFGTKAHVDPGTGTDPIYTFENSTNANQLSVARYAPGPGSHGGRWMIHHVTWVNDADRGILITKYSDLAWYVSHGRLTVERDEAADFRCPIIPNG